MTTPQQQAESLALLLLPDGLNEALRGNIHAQFGVNLNPVVVGLVIDLQRKQLALTVLSLIESYQGVGTGDDRTNEPEPRF